MTQTTASQAEPRLRTNLDTDFLKLIAVFSMIIDHVGGAFFPDYIAFRAIGRLAFPLFCYCMTVGLLYTRNVKSYLLRLGAFALLSQPFYILAFHPRDFLAEFWNLNIFFTLFLSLLAMWGFKTRKYWLFAAAVFVLAWFNFDYGMQGVLLMLIFYLCRNRPAIGAALFALNYLGGFFGVQQGAYLSMDIGAYTFSVTVFALALLPLIFLRTNTHVKIPKFVFYAAYPAHLAVIAAVRLATGL